MSELIKYTKSLIDMLNGEPKEYHKWFLKNAELYTNVNKERSKQLSKYSKIKRCYDNCFKHVYKPKNFDLEYVEGYTLSLIPIEHAFLVDKNNSIIDPTLAINTASHKDRYGSEYIGIKIPRRILIKLKASDKNYLPLPYLYYKYLQNKEI